MEKSTSRKKELDQDTEDAENQGEMKRSPKSSEVKDHGDFTGERERSGCYLLFGIFWETKKFVSSFQRFYRLGDSPSLMNWQPTIQKLCSDSGGWLKCATIALTFFIGCCSHWAHVTTWTYQICRESDY